MQTVGFEPTRAETHRGLNTTSYNGRPFSEESWVQTTRASLQSAAKPQALTPSFTDLFIAPLSGQAVWIERVTLSTGRWKR